jgi:uncharacterized membrane protein YciS (DUF1049 family)
MLVIQLSLLFVGGMNPLWVVFTYHIEKDNYEVSSLLDLCVCVVLFVAFHHWHRVAIVVIDDVVIIPYVICVISVWFYRVECSE